MIYHAEPGENCYSFTTRVIAMMIYKVNTVLHLCSME